MNGEAISQREFGVYYQRLMDLYRDFFKGALTQEAIKNLNLKGAVMEELIQRRVLLQEARRLGLEVTDEELMDAIAGMAEFQVNGRFSKNRYQQMLRTNRLAPGPFEAERREELAIQKLYDIIQDVIHVTESEVREQYRVAQEKVNFYFIRLSASDFSSRAEITAEEIKNYYERNKEALKEPPKVQVEYVVYPFDRFSSKVQVSEKEIEDFYQRHRQTRFHQARTLRLRHILVRVSSGADAQQREKARLRAEGVLQESRAGKDFAELAKKYSEDPSAARGGDIGWIARGQMVAPLEQVVFGLKKGELSAAVESPLGYHIFKVEEVKEEKKVGLKEATPEIVRAIRVERGKTEAARAVDADREKALSGTDLSALAKERDLASKVSPFFGRSEILPEVGPMEEFNRTAFSLAAREVSPVIEGAHGYYLLRVSQRKEPALPPLESLRPEIEMRLKETKAFELATRRAQALLEQLRKEGDIKRVAKEHGLQVGETGWFLRSDAEIAKIGMLQEVRPGAMAISLRQPVAERPYTQGNSVYLFVFKESQGADMGRFESDKGRLLQQALAAKRQIAVRKFIESLKAKARVRVEPRILEAG